MARAIFILVGISLGAIVTPDTLKGIAAWPLSIAVLAVSTACMIAGTTSYLRFVHGWDQRSAFLGASPGALAQVMVLAAELGADLRAIAIVQTTRVFLLTLGLPAGLALFGLVSSPIPAPTLPSSTSPDELIILIVVPTFVALALQWIRFPGGLLFGAMFASALLHGGGFIKVVLPWWVTAAGMIGLGAVTGARFVNTQPRVLMSYIGAAFGSFAVGIAIATFFMLVLTSMLSLPIADVVVAFAPGAQDTMTVLALALHLDPIYVGAHHLARYMVVSLSLPFLARRMTAGPPGRRLGGR
jgi:uncharacterized protein